MACAEYTSDRAAEIRARAHRGPNANALDAARDEQRIGLSRCHTSPRYWAQYTVSGAWVRLRSSGERQPRVPDIARGRIDSFSRRSRSRLIQQCVKVDRSKQAGALFVTLTYPSSWPADSSSWKRHLDSFWKRCQREYPHLSAIWKLEFQLRGAPHFHLLVYGQPFVPHAWIAEQWFEVVGSGDEAHRKAGTEVRRVESYRHAAYYASKYLSKIQTNGEGGAYVGRYWGVLGRRHIPVNCAERRLDPRSFVRLARVLRGVARSRRKRRGHPTKSARWLILNGARAGPLIEWATGGLVYHPAEQEEAFWRSRN